ncbi:hypothetical protein THAOC_30397, partial [Thalassiosira oceanica]
MKDVTRVEATNLRYRLLKNLSIRGWEYDEKNAAEYAKQQDTLYNEDLAAEIEAGGVESLTNLMSLHRGLAQEEEGYDYRTATDSEGRFSGTAWRTGRMGGRLKNSGKAMLFMDDSRSGINTSGFCFWNLVIVDADGKVGVVLGAMTMSASADIPTYRRDDIPTPRQPRHNDRIIPASTYRPRLVPTASDVPPQRTDRD